MKTNNTYKMDYMFISRGRAILRDKIIFTAENPVVAVMSAARYWKGRQKSFPSYYVKLYVTTVFRYDLGPIGENGELTNPVNIPIFEFKADATDATFDEYVELACKHMLKGI